MPPSPAKGGRKASARATTGASSVNRAQNQKANVTHYGVNPVCRCLNKTAWTEKIEAFKKKPNDPSVEIPLPLKDTGVCFDFAIRPQTPGTYQPFAGKGKDEATAEKEARQAAKKEFQKKSASFAVKGAKALLVQDTGNPSLGRASGYCGFASYTAFITFLWFECKSELAPLVETLTDGAWLHSRQSFDQGGPTSPFSVQVLTGSPHPHGRQPFCQHSSSRPQDFGSHPAPLP